MSFETGIIGRSVPVNSGQTGTIIRRRRLPRERKITVQNTPTKSASTRQQTYEEPYYEDGLYQEPLKKRRRWWLWLIVGLILVGIIGLIIWFLTRNNSSEEETNPGTPSGCSITGCPGNLLCNSTTGSCVACLVDGNCETGETCNASGVCVPDMVDPPDTCTTNADCATGLRCGTGGLCEPLTCISIADCDPTNQEVCDGALCIEAPEKCTTQTDCTVIDTVCDTVNGFCYCDDNPPNFDFDLPTGTNHLFFNATYNSTNSGFGHTARFYIDVPGGSINTAVATTNLRILGSPSATLTVKVDPGTDFIPLFYGVQYDFFIEFQSPCMSAEGRTTVIEKRGVVFEDPACVNIFAPETYVFTSVASGVLNLQGPASTIPAFFFGSTISGFHPLNYEFFGGVNPTTPASGGVTTYTFMTGTDGNTPNIADRTVAPYSMVAGTTYYLRVVFATNDNAPLALTTICNMSSIELAITAV